MLMVIKRSGREEIFDIEKIKSTLGIASDELGEPLTQSGINLIIEPVLKRLEGKNKVTSKEIFAEVVLSMRNNGFSALADSYTSKSSILI
jgi:transcriptional regulator NrdR family protein